MGGHTISVPGQVMPDELNRGACDIDAWLVATGHTSPQTKQTTSGAPRMTGRIESSANIGCMPTTRARGEYSKPGTRACVGTVPAGKHKGKSCEQAWATVKAESRSDAKADEWCGKVCALGPDDSKPGRR